MAQSIQARVNVLSIAKIAEGFDQDEWICANGGRFDTHELMVSCVINDDEQKYISMGDRWISHEEFEVDPAKPVTDKLKSMGIDLVEDLAVDLHAFMEQPLDDEYDLENNWYFEITEDGETELSNFPDAKFVFNISFYDEDNFTLNDDGSIDDEHEPLDHLEFVGLVD